MGLDAAQQSDFERDGFLIFRDFLSVEECAVLRGEIDRLAQIDDPCVVREGSTGQAKAMFRMHEPDGATASPPFRALTRLPRVFAPACQVLGDDALYLHHTKINMKPAIEGSAWPWHQDFGSWQRDGIAAPDLVTLAVLLDDATEFNGCLYFLPGSHQGGLRAPRWDDSTAYHFWALPPDDVRRTMAASPPPLAFTGRAGDAALFHCNLFHASGHNLSSNNRWQAYLCFNRVANRPAAVDKPRPDYVRSRNWRPIEAGPEDGILREGAVQR